MPRAEHSLLIIPGELSPVPKPGEPGWGVGLIFVFFSIPSLVFLKSEFGVSQTFISAKCREDLCTWLGVSITQIPRAALEENTHPNKLTETTTRGGGAWEGISAWNLGFSVV